MARAPWLQTRFRGRTAALGLAVVGGVLAVVLAFVLFPYHSLNHDEAVYLNQAALLLDGNLHLHPPVRGAFRPWFFVASPAGLYPKYTPYPAVLYAVGMVVGNARFALFAVGAAVVGLTYLLGSEVDTRRTGLVAAGFVLASPLFVVDTSTFLPYAPVAALNLGFAYSYFRAERTRSTWWALLAGGLVGLSFFARQYTAVLFAVPFVVHATWTLRDRTRGVLVRRVGTACLGCCGVALALGYNRLLTGNALVFPYAAFAPNDGLGFGPHSLRGYGHDYTPVVALRANAVVVWRLLSRWVAGGPLGSALAAVGLVSLLRRGRAADGRFLTLAGLYPSVVLGNVLFWGNYNLLAPDFDASHGLLHYLGPYYHFALLAPTAIFAALGLRGIFRLVRPRLARLDPRAALAVGLVVCVVGAATVGGALAGPLARNAANTGQYERGYAPFIDGNVSANSVVFLPTTDNAWLDHPFQYLRNDPDSDSSTLYALDGVNSLAVTDAYPNRTYYRYEFRGTWVPTDDLSVHPALQRINVTRGRTISENLTIRVPTGTDFASVRVATGSGHVYDDLDATPGNHTVTFSVNATRVRVGGDRKRASTNGSTSLPVNASDDVTATVYIETGPSVGFSYRSRLPVGFQNGTRAAITPYLEACTDPQTCGGGAAYLPNRVSNEYYINATLRNESA